MEYFHETGILQIQKIQNIFGPYESIILWMTRAGDPKNAFLIYFPLVYCVCRKYGQRVFLAAVITEWIMFGQRPYWWVHEYSKPVPRLVQYPLTCETGPGSPSGHAMVTAAVYYIVTDAIRPILPRSTQFWLPHGIFVIAMLPIGVSRIFIAAHFPHQVIGGVICGGIIGALLNKYVNMETWKLSDYLVISLILFCTAHGFNVFLGYMGIDFNWSIPLALKWCEKPDEWISLSTTPYNSVVRDAAALMGFGVAQQLQTKFKVKLSSSNTTTYKALHITLSIVFVNALVRAHYEFDNTALFYFFTAVKYVIIPNIVVFFVPFLLQKSGFTKNSKCVLQKNK